MAKDAVNKVKGKRKQYTVVVFTDLFNTFGAIYSTMGQTVVPVRNKALNKASSCLTS